MYRIAHGGGGEHHAAHSANTAAPFANTVSFAAPFVHRCVGRAFVVLARAYGTVILPPLQLLLQLLLRLLHLLLMTG